MGKNNLLLLFCLPYLLYPNTKKNPMTEIDKTLHPKLQY